MALNILPDRDEFAKLKLAYSQPHRSYHTLKHLSECLEKIDWAASNRQFKSWDDLKLVEAALWYHDAIYQPQASNNEQNSANWACRFFRISQLKPKQCQFIRSLILATDHREIPIDKHHQLIVDIDLSILSAQADRFQEYEKQIRQEYDWVSRTTYAKKRQEVLNFFLSKPRIYFTQLFYDRFEDRARRNLQKSIEKLSREIL